MSQSSEHHEPVEFHSFQDTQGVIIVTTNDLPGYTIEEVYGTVYGLTVRSRNLAANIGAAFKSIVGGEIQTLTKNLYEGRNLAVDKLIGEAKARGANAIIAFRYDNGSLADLISEICAYGTACKVVKNKA